MKKDKVGYSKYPYVIFNEKWVSDMMDTYYRCVKEKKMMTSGPFYSMNISCGYMDLVGNMIYIGKIITIEYNRAYYNSAHKIVIYYDDSVHYIKEIDYYYEDGTILKMYYDANIDKLGYVTRKLKNYVFYKCDKMDMNPVPIYADECVVKELKGGENK